MKIEQQTKVRRKNRENIDRRKDRTDIRSSRVNGNTEREKNINK